MLGKFKTAHSMFGDTLMLIFVGCMNLIISNIKMLNIYVLLKSMYKDIQVHVPQENIPYTETESKE